MTPLLDLAFSLLIIFMIAAPLLEQSIEIELPTETARPQDPREPDEIQAVSIDAEGRIFWGGERVNLPTLRERLAELANLPEPPILAIRGDAEVRYQAVIDVIDAIKEQNLTRLMLDTRAE